MYVPAAGLVAQCRFVEELGEIDLSGYNCVIVDECHFMTAAQVRQLVDIVDEQDIPVICYGLRTDFRGELFEGSRELLRWAGHELRNQDGLLVRAQGDVQCARAERPYCPRGRTDHDGGIPPM